MDLTKAINSAGLATTVAGGTDPNLGSVTVLCTDKTGTLTLGKLELVRYRFKDVVEYKRANRVPILPDAKVALIVAGDQPNSRSSGTMRTPGVARIPAPTSSTAKVTAMTIQA